MSLTTETRPPTRPWVKIMIFAGLLAVAAIALARYRDELSLEQLAQHEQTMRRWQAAHPLAVYAGAFLLYALLTGIPFFPGAAALSLAYGWFFGFWRALLIVSFASTLGATLSFLLSRYLLRDVVEQRWGDRLAGLRKNLEQEGPFYLFGLRLLPVFPFFLVNLFMGLTPMRVRTFWLVSQLGMLPGTCVYLWTGASVPDLHTLSQRGPTGILSPQLLLALTMLGVFPFLARSLMRRWRPRQSPDES